MSNEALLKEYDARLSKALAGGGEDKYAKRTAQGVWNARERIAYLLDKDTFIESGLFGSSGVYPEQVDETQTDGKLAGYARIDGRDVAVVVNDFTVKGASTSATNSKKVAHMKRTAFIVNTARGGIIDEKALYEALRENRIAGAALDVFDQEPTPTDNPLLKLDNFICAPHMAGVTQEAVARMAVVTVQNMLSVLDGKPNRENVVNKEVLS